MKIGSVSVKKLNKRSIVQAEYSDGPVEDEILKIVQDPNFEKRRSEILNNDPSWPVRYHLSPIRANLVNWYSFDKKARVLEIGAGCGAITEALVKQDVHVDALELSERRAIINATRNQKAKNLNVLIGNLEVLEATRPYDYAVCVGVLEYAGRFTSGAKPYEMFLKKINSVLTPGGTLLLAIENKFGIKYFNGSREDHTGAFYDSLMDYPKNEGVRTFSKKELQELFDATGFEELRWFFPVPDYKLPRLVLSEVALETNLPPALLTKLHPAPAPDRTRVYNASEQLLLRSVLKAGMFAEMSNSFLVEAKKGNK